MEADGITREEIDDLLRFLPLFDMPGREFVLGWTGGETIDDSTVTMLHPVYTEDVLEFFWLAGQACWSDFEYKPAEQATRLGDDAFIQKATLAEIKSLLTYCVRAERFGEGHWAAVLESGRVTAILRRLAVLRESLSDGAASGRDPLSD